MMAFPTSAGCNWPVLLIHLLTYRKFDKFSHKELRQQRTPQLQNCHMQCLQGRASTRNTLNHGLITHTLNANFPWSIWAKITQMETQMKHSQTKTNRELFQDTVYADVLYMA